MKTNSWITAGQAKTYRQAPAYWGPNRRRDIKEWSIAINNDWFDN